MERPTGVQISRFLKAQGVQYVFGIPGVHNQELYRGIEEAGLVHILARHEQGAGFMADGYARASGKPGIVYVITGPGICNVLTALGQSYSDSIPILAISSCLDETAHRRGQLHQMLDQERAAGSVCEWSETAQNYKAAYGLLDRAFIEFSDKRCRPKHIQVPIKVLEKTAPDFKITAKPTASLSYNENEIIKVSQLIKTSKKPIFIVGGGAKDADVFKLVEKTGAACFTSFTGRGLIPSKYPLLMGSSLARPDTVGVLSKSDLLVVLGSELAEVDIWRYNLGHKCTLVRVDTDPEVLSDHHKADLKVNMKVADFVEASLKHFNERDSKPTWDAKFISQKRKEWISQAKREFPGVAKVVKAVEEIVPHETVIYSDMTQFAYLAKEIWDMEKPNHWHHPYGFGTLGYALPAAIGGCIARPNMPTLAIAGDYGFQYTIQELGTAVELQLNLPILIWDNHKLKAIEDSMIAAQISPNSVQALNPDFCKLAESYGARSTKPSNLNKLQNDITEAFAAKTPTIIHITDMV